MLEMRPGCERCDTDLPGDSRLAFVCSFECTFCQKCAESFGKVCPNCGGELVGRPTRDGTRLAEHPASTRRIYKPK